VFDRGIVMKFGGFSDKLPVNAMSIRIFLSILCQFDLSVAYLMAV